MSNRTSLASITSLRSNLGSPVNKTSIKSSRTIASERYSDLVDDEDEDYWFVEPPPDFLKCKLCEGVFRTPVVLTCGHTVCRACTHQTGGCSQCGAEMRMVVENLSLAEQIGQLDIYCDFGISEEGTQDPDGCPEVLKLSERKKHREECVYAPANCPNSPNCTGLRKHQLAKHLEECTIRRCSFNKSGCPKIGERDTIEDHENGCIFALMGDSLSQAIDNKIKERDDKVIIPSIKRLDDRISQLSLDLQQNTSSSNLVTRFESELRDLRSEVSLLSNQLNDLTAKFNAGILATHEPQGKIFKVKGTFVGHQGQVWCLAMTGDVLFSGGGDADIKCWDTTQTFRCQKTLEGHTKPILAMVVQNQQLYSTGLDQSILLWNVTKLSFVHRIDKAHDKAVCSIAATSKYLFTGSLNSVKVWKIQDLPIANDSKAPIEYLQELKDVSNYVRSLAVSDKKLYGGSTKLITIWDIDSFKLLKQVTMQGEVYSLHITKEYIFAGTDEKIVHVWNNDEDMEVLCRLRGHAGTIHSIRSLRIGESERVFSASADRSLRVWSMENKLCAQILDRHQGNVTSLAVSRGRVFSGSVDQTVKVWV